MSGYIGTQPVPQATQTRDAFTCTAGQTSFATSGYTPGFLDVYLNGIKLAAADYTASNGSDVVLASGAALDDILEVVAYTSFEIVTDTVTNAGTVLNLDRTGSDGTILDLKKDGSSVGSIKVKSDRLAITDNTYGGIAFANGGNSLLPTTNDGTPTNNHMDFGNAVQKWKDLYLSGGVYLGGTGSANKLDDYEEGTWTPAWTSVTNPSYTLQLGYYTRVGRLVTFHMSLQWNGGTSIGANVGGLPFAVQNSNQMYFMSSTYHDAGITYGSGRTTLVAYPVLSQTYLQLNANGSAIAGIAPTIATGGTLYATGFYYAA